MCLNMIYYIVYYVNLLPLYLDLLGHSFFFFFFFSCSVRMERLRELKEASKTAATNGTTQFETALEEKPASVLDIAGVVADDVVPPPKLVLPRKRKVTETVAIVDKEELSDDSSEDEEGGGGAGMVDWRAKKSVKK